LFLNRHRETAGMVERAIQYPPRAYVEFFLLMAVLAVVSFALVFFVPETRGLAGSAGAERDRPGAD